MSPLLRSDEKKVGAIGQVIPTEDVILSLMETLVGPLLPLNVSTAPPQPDEQKSVAKQMHAVALLYNYHHRKQNPELKFLDFASFCKLVLELRQSLLPFMGMMVKSEPIEPNISNNQLSLTEKAIKEACDIALALDTSVEFPKVEGWPISEVAILLIDSDKENCMLRFGDVTDGVWSPISRELNEPKMNTEYLFEEKSGDKRKQKYSRTHVNGFLQLAFDVVKDVTGISSCYLRVLGNHITYSLRKKRSAVCFYMMQCSRLLLVDDEVSLKFLAESLRGPLAEKVDRAWKTTPVVEFYHMVPYAEIISRWLLGEGSSLPNSDGCMAQTRRGGLLFSGHGPGKRGSEIKAILSEETACENSDKIKRECSSRGRGRPRKRALSQEKTKNGNNMDKWGEGPATMVITRDLLISGRVPDKRGSEIKANFFEEIACESSDKIKGKCSSRGRGRPRKTTLSQEKTKNGNNMDKCGERPGTMVITRDLLISGRAPDKRGSEIKEIACEDSEKIKLKCSSRGRGRPRKMAVSELKTVKGNNMDKCGKKHATINSEKNENFRANSEASHTDGEEMMADNNLMDELNKQRCNLSLLTAKERGKTAKRVKISDTKGDERDRDLLSEKMNAGGNSKIFLKSKYANEKLGLEVKLSDHIRKSNNASIEDDEPEPIIEVDGNLEVNMEDLLTTQSLDEKHIGDQMDGPEAENRHSLQVENALASDDMGNALALLETKRKGLHFRLCNMEGTLAVYEDAIARLSYGNEVGLARECIKSILSGDDISVSEYGTQNQCKGNSQHRLSGIYLPGKSSLQDLEYICIKNNWRLPRYLIEPSDGQFTSDVFVKGKNFDLNSKGGAESRPHEARESAATQMIAQLKNLQEIEINTY